VQKNRAFVAGNPGDSGMKSLLSDLQRLIRQPSISSKSIGLEECASIVAEIMQESGIVTKILRVEGENDDGDTKIPPIVFGEVKSKSNPNGKTILFYNHYDVQPVEPVSSWNRHPFSGDISEGKIWGRGAADDKGELIVRIKGINRLLIEKQDVPCNIKFLVEGEEEIGSPNLGRYLERFRHIFECDAIIWEFGYVDAKSTPIINLGMKGILYVELTSVGPSLDIHSSMAVLVQNPAWRMIKALDTLYDENTGRITIKDWYNEVTPLSPEELSFIASQPMFDEEGFKKKYHIRGFVAGRRGNTLKRSLADSPTCNISGIASGYIGVAAKTVLPSIAKARIDFRLVPHMMPSLQFKRLQKHLKQKGFDDISVRWIHGSASSRTEFKHPFVDIVRESARSVFGKNPVVNLSSAGSGPMYFLVQALKVPCVAVGCSYIFSNIHSHNEFARIDLLKQGISLIKEIITTFARS
jgi:acetylornithine deacetylase/succinyl-diaminopimelate desuccinylase-like protein